MTVNHPSKPISEIYGSRLNNSIEPLPNYFSESNYMPYNHLRNLEELDQNALILNGYDYTHNDPYGEAEAYFQFCQTNLSEHQQNWNVQPARFFIRDVASINALAALRHNYYVIGVNKGTVIRTHFFFDSIRQVLKQADFSAYAELEAHLPDDIARLMYQTCLQWVYYHELAHLIQYSQLDNAPCAEQAQQELEMEESYSDNPTNDPYDQEKHLKEFDADLHGGYFIVLQLIGYWKQLSENRRNTANLTLLLSAGASAIFSYFILMMQRYPDIYYLASDHPHPLVRVLYIIDQFLKVTAKELSPEIAPEATTILTKTFQLSESLYLHYSGVNYVKAFADIFKNEKENIEQYVNDVLIPNSKQMPCLVLERMRAQKNQVEF